MRDSGVFLQDLLRECVRPSVSCNIHCGTVPSVAGFWVREEVCADTWAKMSVTIHVASAQQHDGGDKDPHDSRVPGCSRGGFQRCVELGLGRGDSEIFATAFHGIFPQRLPAVIHDVFLWSEAKCQREIMAVMFRSVGALWLSRKALELVECEMATEMFQVRDV